MFFFLFFDVFNHRKIHIFWNDVAEIYIYQDPWRGMLFYKVFLINSQYSSASSKGQCDLLIPIYSVDADILHSFIPESILKSNIHNNV